MLLVTLAAAFCYVMAAQQDLAHRRIPNVISLALLVLGFVKWGFLWQLDSFLWAIFAASVMFAVTAFMNWRKWLGGGDVKLLSASSFLIGSHDTYPFVMWTALIGGLVSIIVLAVSLVFRYVIKTKAEVGDVAGGDGAAERAHITVPYGVAISLAAIWILFCQTH